LVISVLIKKIAGINAAFLYLVIITPLFKISLSEADYDSFWSYVKFFPVSNNHARINLNPMTIVANDNGFCTTEIIPIKCCTGNLPKLLMYLMRSPMFLDYVNLKSYGTKMPQLGTEDAKIALFSLPPKDEQKRIVDKIVRLMSLCDELEARKQKKTKTRIALNQAALDRLLAARTPKTFKNHRQFIHRNFDLLYDHPQNVSKFRQAILQLAVQGKLVPQNPADEPASVLLEKIKAEKERLLKAKKIKKSKPLPPIGKDEIQYQLPDGWEWTRLIQICLINPRNKIDNEKEVAFIPMKLVPTEFGGQIQHETRQWKNIKKGFTHFAEGDVAAAKITPCFQNRKSAIMRHLKNDLGAGTIELVIFRPINKQLMPEYISIYLKSPKFIINGVNRMTGSAGQKRVPKVYFSENPFPLPPLPEQKRIVTKVDQLMTICNELEVNYHNRNWTVMNCYIRS